MLNNGDMTMRTPLKTTAPTGRAAWLARQLMVAACALGLSVFATAGLVGSASAVYQSNTDRPGGDYRNFEIGKKLMNYIDPCSRACSSDSRCQAWTLVRPGVQGPNARCWLKSVVPAA